MLTCMLEIDGMTCLKSDTLTLRVEPYAATSKQVLAAKMAMTESS
jgi:hypothetical protein